MELLCEGIQIHPAIHGNKKKSMLILGGSRLGKTFLESNLGAELIRENKIVQAIDLGSKWGLRDKQRLMASGAGIRMVKRFKFALIFKTKQELIGCAEYICNALEVHSENVKTVLKGAIGKAVDQMGNIFRFSNLIKMLENIEDTDQEYKKWARRIYERLVNCNEIADICFVLDEEKDFIDCSAIWDFDGIDDSCVKIMTSLVLYCIYCQCRRNFKANRQKDIFVLIDEFQVLNCDRHSIFGICLTEGQKYGLSLILSTQFLQGNFSEAVINQFKQGGFRFYFRLTEEEAGNVSNQLTYNIQDRKKLYHRLVNLPVGTCLMIGPHYVGNCKDISENIRFVKVLGDEDNGGYAGKCLIDLFARTKDGKISLI